MSKKKKSGIIVITVIITLIFAAASAFLIVKILENIGESGTNTSGAGEPPGNSGNPNDPGATGDGNGNTSDDKGNCFIGNGEAKFKIVYTSDSTEKEIACIKGFISKLRSLGVDVPDAVCETDTEISECEIIIGRNASGRGEEFSVDAAYLGSRGYIIKSRETRILVAAGSDEYTAIAMDLLLCDVFGINDDTKELSELYIKVDVLKEQLTTYDTKSVKIGETELSEYCLIVDLQGAKDFENANILSFKNRLFSDTGYILDLVDHDFDAKYRFIIRYTSDAGELGFRAYISGDDLIVECSYANAFDDAFLKFAEACIFNTGNVEIPLNFSYTQDVSKVYYSDFGAKSDDKNDDYQAIYNAHAFANQCGQTVYADENGVYYINEMPEGSIPVMTDTVLGKSVFMIKNRDTVGTSVPLFEILSEKPASVYSDLEQTENVGRIERDQRQILGLISLLSGDSFIKLEGISKNVPISNIFIADGMGRVNSSTSVAYMMDAVNKITVKTYNDMPISFNGGMFITDSSEASDSAVIAVFRSNVTLKDIVHVFKEGKKTEFYPVQISEVYNCRLKNLSVNVFVKDSIDICIDGLKTRGTACYSLLASDVKNAEIKNSVLEKTEAIRVYGLKLCDNRLSESLVVSGGGSLEIERTSVEDGESFITLPAEHGASFCGDVIIRECEFNNEATGSSYLIKSEFDSDDPAYSADKFGYTLHMPKSVNLEAFSSSSEIYLFNPIPDFVFENSYNICERVIYKDMHSLKITAEGPDFSLMNGISVTNETYINES